MANIRIAYDNWHDASATTVTASSAETDFPVANMADDLHLKHWRATGDTAEWVKWDLGSAQTPTVLILKYHNFTAGATVVLEGHASDAWGAPTYQETVTVTTGTVVFFVTTSALQWWRLTIADAANPDTYVRIGRVFLGTYFTPTYNYLLPLEKDYVDDSNIAYSMGGQAFVDEKTQYRIFNYAFLTTSSSNFATMKTIYETVGKSLAYFIVEDSADASPYLGTYYVRNTGEWKFSKTQDELYATSITAEECR